MTSPCSKAAKAMSQSRASASKSRITQGSKAAKAGAKVHAPSAYFKLDDAGTYRFFIKGTGGIGRRQGQLQNRPLRMTLVEGVIVSRYFSCWHCCACSPRSQNLCCVIASNASVGHPFWKRATTMNRLFAAVFASMTAVAGYTTSSDVGVQDSSYEAAKGPPSLRVGSARARRSALGGSRGGK
jgi:hypothetical protein